MTTQRQREYAKENALILKEITRLLTRYGALSPRQIHNLLPQYSYYRLYDFIAPGGDGQITQCCRGKYTLRTHIPPDGRCITCNHPIYVDRVFAECPHCQRRYKKGDEQ